MIAGRTSEDFQPTTKSFREQAGEMGFAEQAEATVNNSAEHRTVNLQSYSLRENATDIYPGNA